MPTRLRLHELQITPTQQSLPESNKSQKSSKSSLNQIEPVQENESWSEWNSFWGTGQYKDAIIMLLFFKINLNIQIDKSIGTLPKPKTKFETLIHHPPILNQKQSILGTFTLILLVVHLSCETVDLLCLLWSIRHEPLQTDRLISSWTVHFEWTNQY